MICNCSHRHFGSKEEIEKIAQNEKIQAEDAASKATDSGAKYAAGAAKKATDSEDKYAAGT